METSRGHVCVAYTAQNVAFLSGWCTQCHILLSFGYCNCTSKMRPLSCVQPVASGSLWQACLLQEL